MSRHAATLGAARPRALVPFRNLGPALTHLVMPIFPTAVLALGPAWGLSYDALMPATLGGLIAYGAGSLPSGWLGDRWSRRSMIAAFFLGTGAGAILCGFAGTPLQIGIALSVVGLFASIYHPVGLSLLVIDPARLGRTLGLNGVFGNLGIASAAIVTGLLCEALGWRWAFIAPGLLSILAGLAFLALVPGLPEAGARAPDSSRSGGAQSFTLAMAAALLLFIVCDSLVFNATTIALPKVAEWHMAGWFESPAAVGTIVSIVFAIAALAQLWIGHLIDRVPLGRIFLPLAAAQVVAMLATGTFGVLPFCALGLLVGTLVKGQAAPGMVNLVYLPMAFLSGLWLPLSMLPKALGSIAPAWPSYHLNALMQVAVGTQHGGVASHLLALAGFTAAFLLLAARRLRRHG